jgi:hypothetical protein
LLVGLMCLRDRHEETDVGGITLMAHVVGKGADDEGADISELEGLYMA